MMVSHILCYCPDHSCMMNLDPTGWLSPPPNIEATVFSNLISSMGKSAAVSHDPPSRFIKKPEDNPRIHSASFLCSANGSCSGRLRSDRPIYRYMAVPLLHGNLDPEELESSHQGQDRRHILWSRVLMGCI